MAKRLDKEYVAVMIDVDKDEVVPPLYDVSAMPTLVITDAEGNELAKSVGAPFSDPEGAIKWFDEIGGKINAFSELQTKWDDSKHADAAVGEKYAEAANELGKTSAAIEAYKALIELAGEDKAKAGALHTLVAKMLLDNSDLEGATEHANLADKLLPAEGDARIDADLLRAQILMWSDDAAGARKLCDKHYDNLVKAADERAIDLASTILGTIDSDDEKAVPTKGREMYLKLAEVFAKHERVWELKVYAAYFALSCDQEEAGVKELKEVIEKGKGDWVKIAKDVLERHEKKDAGDDEGSDEGDDEDSDDEDMG
ncbi:MAG: hypothetical protein H6839_07960 [Planctomycetes bacterium]|nr:hypothetical protein [Planctomycetota bacterium]